jgi:hypothetical protein
MDVNSIIASLDAEIELLKQARAVLSGAESTNTTPKPVQATKPKKAAKRVLSPEARKRIADAQRKRWAAVKRSKKSASVAAPTKAAKKSAAKKKKASPKKATKKKAAAKKATPKKASPARIEGPNTAVATA